MVRLDLVRQAGFGKLRLGGALHGEVRHGEAGEVSFVMVRSARRGWSGRQGQGEAWFVTSMSGEVGLVMDRRGRQGMVRTDLARLGLEWQA